MPRLRTVSPSSRGFSRRRAGSGFTYLDKDGRRITDADEVEVAGRHANDQVLLGDNPEDEVLTVLSLDRPHLDVLDDCGPVIGIDDRFADGESHMFSSPS